MDTQSKSVLCATQSLAIKIRMRGSKPTLGKGGAWTMEGRRPGRHTILRSLDKAQWQGSVRVEMALTSWSLSAGNEYGKKHQCGIRARQTTTNKLYQHAYNHCLMFRVKQTTTNELATTLGFDLLLVVLIWSPPDQCSPIPPFPKSMFHFLPSPTLTTTLRQDSSRLCADLVSFLPWPRLPLFPKLALSLLS